MTLTAVLTTGYLTAYWCRNRSSGTSYWAFMFVDVETGIEVKGKISGGESNIYGILRYWNVVNDWDRSIQFECVKMKEREFDRMVKGWEYAGCLPMELANFIRNKLGKPQRVDVRVELTGTFYIEVPTGVSKEDAQVMAYDAVEAKLAELCGKPHLINDAGKVQEIGLFCQKKTLG